MIDLFAWIVLLTMIVSAIAVFVILGLWPGRVAHARKHPYADAIQVGSWILLLMGAVFWPFILIWAYATPQRENKFLAQPEEPKT